MAERCRRTAGIGAKASADPQATQGNSLTADGPDIARRRSRRPPHRRPSAYLYEPGAFGIRPEPAAAILRRCGMQTRRAPGRRRMRRSARSSGLAWSRQLSRCRRTAQFDRGCVKKLKSQQGRRIVFSIALAPIAATARYSSLD
jgi:hypothetical protein